jgi:ketosteroid isomerase-like protein
VTVDIDVHIGGAENRVRDVFELRDGRIRSLVVRGFADALRSANTDAG